VADRRQDVEITSSGADDDRALELAKSVVAGQTVSIPGEQKYGALSTFSDEEHRQLSALEALVCGYLERKSPQRPLCLALFGPPGSGKSFAAKQIRLQVQKSLGETNLKLPLTVLNMTQVPAPAELAKTLSRIASEQDGDTVPFVFFDEFDGTLAGMPLGWLAWFLAPMNDGEFLHDGTVTRLKRAVYIFAGGTCSRMSEFADGHGHHEKDFVAAKGPDFVSRLRGYGDILGPNAAPLLPRRAVILRAELDARLKAEDNRPSIEDALLTELLAVGRYRHGARSIGAVLEMSKIVPHQPIRFQDLPEPHLLALHADRGPLDPKRIGGCIAITGSRNDEEPSRERFDAIWKRNAHVLWRHGATIAYGGRWQDEAAPSPVDMLSEEAKALPRGLNRAEKDIRLRNFPTKWAGGVPQPLPETHELVSIEKVHGVDAAEQAELGLDPGAWELVVINLFRMRLQVEEASVARIVVGGKSRGFVGRFSGVAEETMLALALGHPVYVLGAAGGVARRLGELLGLKRPWTGARELSMEDNLSDERKTALEKISDKLRPPPWTTLPVTAKDLHTFLKEHAAGGPLWPPNGLNLEENRRLFEAEDPKVISDLLTAGLLKGLARNSR
jgi:hypothetical protein